MFVRTPAHNVDPSQIKTSDILNRVQILEGALNSFMKNQSDVMKQQAEWMNGIKTLGNANSIGFSNSDNHISRFMKTADISKERNRSESPNKRRKFDEISSEPQEIHEESADYDGNPQDKIPWSEVVNNKKKKDKKQPQKLQPQNSWRNKLNIVRGTSKNVSDGENRNFASDVSLVAYGVSKDVKEDDLKAYLVKKEINVVSCNLLTKFKEAYSHSFKIIVKAQDYEKVQNAEIWPYRVGVRHYKHFRNDRNSIKQSELVGRTGSVKEIVSAMNIIKN